LRRRPQIEVGRHVPTPREISPKIPEKRKLFREFLQREAMNSFVKKDTLFKR